ncbi:hypothetical protein YC2023_024793 [Brassica napus]
MAEILPVRSARTVKSPRSLNSFGSSPGRVDPYNILNRPNGNPSKMVEASTEAHNEKEWVEQDAHGVCISLTALASGVTDLKPEKGLVRKKQNCGGHITEEEESTKNTIYEWLTKPVNASGQFVGLAKVICSFDFNKSIGNKINGLELMRKNTCTLDDLELYEPTQKIISDKNIKQKKLVLGWIRGCRRRSRSGL